MVGMLTLNNSEINNYQHYKRTSGRKKKNATKSKQYGAFKSVKFREIRRWY